MIKAIVFDFDGVIHDTFNFHLNKLREFSGVTDYSPEELKKAHEGNFRTKSMTSRLAGLNFINYRAFICDDFKKQILNEKIKLELEKLAQKYQLFIITSGGETVIGGYLKENKINHLFKEVLGGETHKSKVVKFQRIFNKHNLTNNDFIFVTDTVGDILEAHNVDVNTIAVDFGFHERARLEKGKPMKIISNFNEILPLVREI